MVLRRVRQSAVEPREGRRRGPGQRGKFDHGRGGLALGVPPQVTRCGSIMITRNVSREDMNRANGTSFLFFAKYRNDHASRNYRIPSSSPSSCEPPRCNPRSPFSPPPPRWPRRSRQLRRQRPTTTITTAPRRSISRAAAATTTNPPSSTSPTMATTPIRPRTTPSLAMGWRARSGLKPRIWSGWWMRGWQPGVAGVMPVRIAEAGGGAGEEYRRLIGDGEGRAYGAA